MGSGGDFIRDPLQLGLTIVGVTAAIGGAGWWLDSLIGTFPFLMMIGAVAGLCGVLYVIILRLRQGDNLKANRSPDESL